MIMCSLCHRDADELLPIENPGKQYTHCCSRCKQVASLIGQNYPFNEDWYRDHIRYFPLILTPHSLPEAFGNELLFGDDARNLLRRLIDKLTELLVGFLREVRAIDVVVALARLFSDLTYTASTPSALSSMIASARQYAGRDINSGWFAARLADLRMETLFLQNMLIKFGSADIRHSNFDTDTAFKLLSIARQISQLSSLDDTLYYELAGTAGLAIVDSRPILITAEGEPVQFGDKELFDATIEELIDPSAGDDPITEFYEVAHRLDGSVLEALHFTVGDLFSAYMGLAEFARRRNGLFVLTPHELERLLSAILQTEDEHRIRPLAAYLQCTRATAAARMHELEASFYSPLLAVPVGEYEMIVLCEETIVLARTNFFHDFTYGTHPALSQNVKLQKEYSRLKQAHITGPFERKTANAFVDLGWKVVMNVSGGIVVERKVVAVIPEQVGEIDLIALSPDGKMLVVADCKYMFDYGATARDMRAIYQRFTGEKSHRSQLERKLEWVTSRTKEIVQALAGAGAAMTPATKGMIVTRNRVPLAGSGNIAVLSLYDLKKWLAGFRQA